MHPIEKNILFRPIRLTWLRRWFQAALAFAIRQVRLVRRWFVAALAFAIRQVRLVWVRRWLVAALAFALLIVPAVLWIHSLPNTYRATATVLVEGPWTPDGSVQSTATSPAEYRMKYLSEVDLIVHLEELVQRLGLVTDPDTPVDTLVDRLRKDISLEWKPLVTPGQYPFTFSVSYQGTDMDKVANVTMGIAGFLVERESGHRARQLRDIQDLFEEMLHRAREGVLVTERHMANLEQHESRGDLDPSIRQILTLEREIYAENYATLMRRKLETERAVYNERKNGEELRIVRMADPELVIHPTRYLLWGSAFLSAFVVAGLILWRPGKPPATDP